MTNCNHPRQSPNPRDARLEDKTLWRTVGDAKRVLLLARVSFLTTSS